MSVNLQKGQKVDLRKSTGEGLRKVVVGLGWDEAQQRGLFSRPQPIDCDASAILLVGGKFTNKGDVVYFGNKRHSTQAVVHTGDNLTGAGSGDDEQIIVELAKLPEQYDRVVFVANIYQAVQRKQHFGMIRNAFIRIVDADNGQEMCKFNLSDSYDGMTAVIFGELYRRNGAWKFNAIGQATTDPGLAQLIARYQ